MKIMVTFVGILTILGGLLPFLEKMNWLPESVKWIPTSGPWYQAIIIGVGVIAVIYGIMKSSSEL